MCIYIFYYQYKANFKWECSYDWEIDNYVKPSYSIKRITKSISWTGCHCNEYCNHYIKIVRYYYLYFIVSFNKPNPFIITFVKHCEQIRHITYTAHITWMRIVHISNVGVIISTGTLFLPNTGNFLGGHFLGGNFFGGYNLPGYNHRLYFNTFENTGNADWPNRNAIVVNRAMIATQQFYDSFRKSKAFVQNYDKLSLLYFTFLNGVRIMNSMSGHNKNVVL